LKESIKNQRRKKSENWNNFNFGRKLEVFDKMRKICKKCKLIFKGTECPICHSTNLADGFRGKIIIIDPENSELAKKLNIKQKGEYAIKIK